MKMSFARYTTMLVAVGSFAAANAVAEGSAQKFIVDAMQGNLAEVNIGKLAQENSENPAVKEFGTMLRYDHSQAYRAAAVAAASLGEQVPTEPNKDQQNLYTKLAALHGQEFDNEFIGAMLKDHKTDVKMYEKEAKAKDGAVSKYAANTLPTLRKHLAAVSKLASGK